MNKFILVLITSFLSITAKAQTEISFSKTLKIEHIYGDESYTVEEMDFEIRDGKVYGKITNPNTDALLNSETKLSENGIKTLNSFLKLVDKYQNDCKEEFTSSYVQYYTVTKDGKEIKIYKFCNWGKVTYFDIKQKIFGNYLKNLEKKKQNLNRELFTLLKGNWKENIHLETLKFDSLFVAKKTNNETLNGYIEFKENNKILIHRNKKIIYYEYRIDVLNGQKYLSIFGDGDKNGEEFIYGHRFLIISLKENEIELKRA